MSRFSFTLAALLAGIVAAPSAHAWDAGDSSTTAARPSADFGGAFFFLDPNDASFVVLAATLRAGISPSQNANLGFFDPKVKLRFEIENSGDAKPDTYIDVKFSPRTAQDATQTATIKLAFGGGFTAPTTVARGAFGPPGPPTFGGGSSAQQISTITTDSSSQVSFFAGLIDDPFFFDLGAFEAYRASRLANQTNPAILTRGRDSFAGSNTMAIVLRVPVASLVGDAGNHLGLSIALKGAGGFKDRVAHPFVNSVLIDYERREAYNGAKTAADASGKFRDEITANLQALQTNGPFVDILTSIAVANGDILRLDTSIPNVGTEGGKNPEAGYPNGRRPNDDVVDTVLTLINNGVFQGDAVNDDELPMRDAFPFFARPHQPFPPGSGSEDLTRN